MNNKYISLSAIILILFSFVSCGSKTLSEPSEISKQKGTVFSASCNLGNGITGSSNFSGGYTYMQLTSVTDYGNTDTYTWLVGCIDSKGNLQYCANVKNAKQCYCKDGYMQIMKDDGWECLNKKGEIQYTYKTSNGSDGTEKKILCGGDRFIAVKESKTGFDSAEKSVYKIIDSEGNILIEYEEENANVIYVGENIFYLDSENLPAKKFSDDRRYLFYNAELQCFIKSPYCENINELEYFKYQDGYCMSYDVIGTADGNLYDISKNIDYESISYVNAENGYLLYYNDNIPYIYNFIENKNYNYFEKLDGHLKKFLYYKEFIIALVNGDDENVYYMITDKDGNIIQDITKLPHSYKMFNSLDIVFFKDTFEVRFFNGEKNFIFDYDLKSRTGKINDVTGKDHVELSSDYYDGWAKATYYTYSKDGSISKIYSSNYINEKGEFLLKVAENGEYPIFYVKKSQLVN